MPYPSHRLTHWDPITLFSQMVFDNPKWGFMSLSCVSVKTGVATISLRCGAGLLEVTPYTAISCIPALKVKVYLYISLHPEFSASSTVRPLLR